mgnify:CR=1 FL=1
MKMSTRVTLVCLNVVIVCALCSQDGVSENEHTSHSGLLQARLKQPRSGNVLCLKLISPGNKMEVGGCVGWASGAWTPAL